MECCADFTATFFICSYFFCLNNKTSSKHLPLSNEVFISFIKLSTGLEHQFCQFLLIGYIAKYHFCIFFGINVKYLGLANIKIKMIICSELLFILFVFLKFFYLNELHQSYYLYWKTGDRAWRNNTEPYSLVVRNYLKQTRAAAYHSLFFQK